MTDEEIIARDLGEVAGAQFLFWDQVVMRGWPGAVEGDHPIQRKALDVIDEYLNKTTDRWDNRETRR